MEHGDPLNPRPEDVEYYIRTPIETLQAILASEPSEPSSIMLATIIRLRESLRFLCGGDDYESPRPRTNTEEETTRVHELCTKLRGCIQSLSNIARFEGAMRGGPDPALQCLLELQELLKAMGVYGELRKKRE